MGKAEDGVRAVNELVDGWLAMRAQIKELERAEHPNITDSLGRSWVWKAGDLYTHDGMCFPDDMITSRRMSPPSQETLDNPNYVHLCDICLDGRQRNLGEHRDGKAE